MFYQCSDLGCGPNDVQDETVFLSQFYNHPMSSWMISSQYGYPPMAPFGGPQAGMMDPETQYRLQDPRDFHLGNPIFPPDTSQSAGPYAPILAGPANWETPVNAALDSFSGFPDAPPPVPAISVVPAYYHGHAYPVAPATAGANHLDYRAPNNVDGIKSPSPVESSSTLQFTSKFSPLPSP
ncbi:hypothetical protein PG996_002700 [Apiospora saccharicola]|uniref:Uncharacterized protein n=1 Tax=Apiospora saccharicola TaxID=335842 RepID=A0ABR1WK77_9PEZI